MSTGREGTMVTCVHVTFPPARCPPKYQHSSAITDQFSSLLDIKSANLYDYPATTRKTRDILCYLVDPNEVRVSNIYGVLMNAIGKYDTNKCSTVEGLK